MELTGLPPVNRHTITNAEKSSLQQFPSVSAPVAHRLDKSLGPFPTAPMLTSMDLMDMNNWSYLEDPPKDIGPARHLLEFYSKIPYQDLDDHIRRVVSVASSIVRVLNRIR